MKLDDVEVIGPHAPQALVHGVRDVLPAVVVQAGQGDANRVRRLGVNRVTSRGHPHLEARKNS